MAESQRNEQSDPNELIVNPATGMPETRAARDEREAQETQQRNDADNNK